MIIVFKIDDLQNISFLFIDKLYIVDRLFGFLGIVGRPYVNNGFAVIYVVS